MKILVFICCLVVFEVSANDILLFKEVAKSSENLIIDSQTEIKLLGSLSNGYKIYNYRHYFNGGIRVSTRLVAIDKDNALVGIYGINDWAVNISGDCVMFPNIKDHGNSICLINNKLPATAWVDGENPVLFK
jgi:hypothetical protein